MFSSSSIDAESIEMRDDESLPSNDLDLKATLREVQSLGMYVSVCVCVYIIINVLCTHILIYANEPPLSVYPCLFSLQLYPHWLVKNVDDLKKIN